MIDDRAPGARGPAEARSTPLALLLGATALWGCWFIFRTSFLSEGRRVFCLFDDAMTSMTYARNLVEGHGLEWARWGPPVEGFTHPLWMLLMVPANALPLALRFRTLPIQLLALALLLANVALVHRLVRRHFSYPRAAHALPAALLTALYYPLAYWSLMGMETALQALVATAAVFLALDSIRLHRDRPLAFGALAAVAYLLRMDMLLPVAALGACVVVYRLGSTERSASGRARWLSGLALAAAAIAGYGLFRWLYFGDLLPNTYYLKLAGVPLVVRLLRGLATLSASLSAHTLLLPAIALGGVAVAADPEERRRLAPPALLFAVACAYDLYVGGDAWEIAEGSRANRFVAYAMPQVFVVGNGLLNRGLDRLAARWPATAVRLALAGATAAALLSADGLWPGAGADGAWQDLTLTRRPSSVVGNEVVHAQLLALERIAAPGAVVASFWAGIPSYFSDFRMVDLLGYNDRTIAHGPPAIDLNEEQFELYRPGHAKWNTDYVLRERTPDAFLQTWGMTEDEQRRVLRPLGYRQRDGFWVLLGSPRIHWPGT